jgi:hypothetical protein
MQQSVSLSGTREHVKEQIEQLPSIAARDICKAIVDGAPGNRFSIAGSVDVGEGATGSATIAVNLSGSSWIDSSTIQG